MPRSIDATIFRVPDPAPGHRASDRLSPERASCFMNRGRLDILDLGCGQARCRQYFLEKGHRYIGIDLEPDAANVCGDAQRLPFADGTFDAVTCTASLHYMLRPDLAFDESFRVLRTSGTITGSVPFLEPWRWGGCVHLSPEGLVLLLERSGFVVTHVWPGWEGTAALNLVAFEPWRRAGAWIGRSHARMMRGWWALCGRYQKRPTPSIVRQLQVAASINFHAIKNARATG